MKITDHALVRYLERFCDLDVQTIKKTITGKIKDVSKGMDGIYNFDQSTNLNAVVKNGAKPKRRLL